MRKKFLGVRIGIGCPKPGFPLVGKATDEKVLSPDELNKENNVKPTSILCEGGP
jgi:hypothetical protein